jgi:hypothetical protein
VAATTVAVPTRTTLRVRDRVERFFCMLKVPSRSVDASIEAHPADSVQKKPG